MDFVGLGLRVVLGLGLGQRVGLNLYPQNSDPVIVKICQPWDPNFGGCCYQTSLLIPRNTLGHDMSYSLNS